MTDWAISRRPAAELPGGPPASVLRPVLRTLDGLVDDVVRTGGRRERVGQVGGTPVHSTSLSTNTAKTVAATSLMSGLAKGIFPRRVPTTA